MITSVLGIHGVRNYKIGDPPTAMSDRIAHVWRTALSKSCSTPIHFHAAYYADLLRSEKQGSQWWGDPADHESIREYLTAWAAAWEVDISGLQGPLTVPVRYIASRIAARLGEGAAGARRIESAAGLFFPEVARYFNTRGGEHARRLAVRSRIIEALATARPNVIIAHSLGSVATYEALHAAPEIEVDLLITLGSPLALPGAVFDRLLPSAHDGMGCKPAGVRRWVDYADVGDIIAIPKGGIASRFRDLDAHYEIKVHPLAFHDVTRYLAHSRVAAELA